MDGGTALTAAELIPPDEAGRLAAVRRYGILDTPPDGAFDRLAAAAADLFGVPMAVVSIVDRDRIWFKARHGVDAVSEVGRDPGLCASAILDEEPWVVTDAALDPRTVANPLVAGDFGLRFYVGAPLTTADGYRLGTLCVLDRAPHDVTPVETRVLSHLASLVVDQLELRLSARKALDVAHGRLQQTEQLAAALQRSLLPPALPDIPHVQLAARYLPASRYQVGGDFYDVFPIDGGTWGLVIGDVCGKGPDAAGRTSCARYSMRAGAIHERAPSDALSVVNRALLVDAAESPHDAPPMLEAPFVTALFARLHPGAGGATVTCAAAGHPLPTLLRVDGTVEHVGVPGTLLGVFPQVRTTDTSFALRPGDTMVLITDGVLDSGSPRLTQDGLDDVLSAAVGLAPEQVAEQILSAVSAGQADDIAILVVRSAP